MDFSHKHYVPCLRWKKGECDAVGQLSASAIGIITPLIEVPEIGYDFARRVFSKTLDEHLAPFAVRVWQKWANRNAFVDARHIANHGNMADGTHPLEFILNELRSVGCSIVPVTDCTHDAGYQRAIRRAASRDNNGVCLRIGIQSATSRAFDSQINNLLDTLAVRPELVDFILDLGSPNYDPVAGFSRVVINVINTLPQLNAWRTFTLLGTSFPASMGDVKRGFTCIPRYEWPLYKMVVKALCAERKRMPAFGDYTINHPDLLPMDMRVLKPTATIRYAVDNAWFIVKGTNVRQKNGFEQFHSHSASVCASEYYMGPDFSAGDAYIANCAVKNAGKGNLTTWRQVGTNHHLEKVARDVASLSYS